MDRRRGGARRRRSPAPLGLPVAESFQHRLRDVLALEAALGQLVVAHARERLEALRHGACRPDIIQEVRNPLVQALQQRWSPLDNVVEYEGGHDVLSFSNSSVASHIGWYYRDFTVLCCIAAILRRMAL